MLSLFRDVQGRIAEGHVWVFDTVCLPTESKAIRDHQNTRRFV